jgi:Prolyl oligopeptidase family
MRKNMLFLMAGCILCHTICFCQKPALTEANLKSWPWLIKGSVSNDGRYAAYFVRLRTEDVRCHLHLKEVNGSFSIEAMVVGYGAKFTEDSRQFLYVNTGDSLVTVDLATRSLSFTPGVAFFEIPKKGGLPLVAWQTKDDSLVLQNRVTGARSVYAHVADFSFTDEGKELRVSLRQGDDSVSVRRINLETGQSSVFYQGKGILKQVTDVTGSKMAFLVGADWDDPQIALWQYDPQKGSTATKLVDATTAGMQGCSLGWDRLQYSPAGDRLFFGLRRPPENVRKDPHSAPVDVWNYKDEYLQSDQVGDPSVEKNRTYLAVVSGSGVLRLEQEREGFFSARLNDGSNDDYMLTATRKNNKEGLRFARERPDVYLVKTRDGSRISLVRQLLNAPVSFSAGGKYVVWYDSVKENFNFYDIGTRTIRTIASPVVSAEHGMYDGSWRWLEGDKGVLMYGRYDIWLVDPKGEKPPVNVTNGYGTRNKIILRLTDPANSVGAVVKPGETLLLNGFNVENKDNGFFHKTLDVAGDPEQLSMGHYLRYSKAITPIYPEADIFLDKASEGNSWLLVRSRSDAFPNLEVTIDFRTFTRISDLAPERNVNWLTSELVRWKTFDGRPGTGILYKPEDFDSTKKYPILFYLSGQGSDHLHLYPVADWTYTRINIPWFVSRGYLVFCPDIQYSGGDPGKGIYNYVVSAAEMLKSRPWVDGNRMGMQGSDFGGFEVNLLVTKTKLFAAAASVAGATDMISQDGEAGFGDGTGQAETEFGRYGMQVPVVENLPIYIRNSAVLGADKVMTPLFLMHCKKDDADPWAQGVEFFSSLRWLGKTAYLLQYDDPRRWADAPPVIDYTRRLTQFFDHYLKGAPEPKWMAEGIPAKLKGIESGLDYSTTTVSQK